MKRRKKATSEPTPSGVFAELPWGLSAALLTALALLLISSAICLSLDDPGAAARPFGYAAMYISAAVGGFVTYKRERGYALLCGTVCGAALLIVTLVAALLMPGVEGTPAWIPVVTRIPVIPFAIAGALVASVKRKRRRKR